MIRWAICAGMLVLHSCAPKAALPGMPALKLEDFQPTVRAEVDKALEAVNQSPRDAGANGRLGMVLHAHDQFASARTMYLRAEALDTKSFQWPYYLAVVESQMGNYDAALLALDRASRISADYLPARLRRAEVLFDLGRLEESGRLYDALTEKQPELAAAWYGKGRVQAALGEPDAVESLRKACELFPHYGSAHYALAQALRKQGKEAEAHKHLEQSEIHKTSVPPSSDDWMAQVQQLSRGAAYLLRLAKDAEESGRAEQAMTYTLQALAADPKSVQAHTNLISVYARVNQAEKAVAHYREAVALNPNHPEAHYNYGVLMFDQRTMGEAKAAFQRALENNPYYADAHNNLGYLLEMEGKMAEAAASYRKAIEIRPSYRLAHFHMGRMMANQRRYREAIDHLEKTLEPEDASTPGYLYALGAVYGRSGQRVRSVDLMKQAREKAASLGQTQLVASIDKDLRILERR
ncbi:MAG: tetratricopeptide repeat protein [Acidimicrobiia bacterium]|nr:tetratricopeptide repeat protein [Acidimicrobiia bacterium]